MKKLFIILTMFSFAGCSGGVDWTGYYYPDKYNIGDESTWVTQPGFKSIDECRDWVNKVSAGNYNYDYECGYGCRYDSQYGTNICKKTEK